MASSSASSHRRPSSYDVFINFRGKDTREGFVSLLYDGLKRGGIYAFIDSEQLWEGEDICPSLLRSIRGSRISIPVFSQHYADSRYCLLELAEIWERRLSDGQTVLPIFFDVEPGDVRYQIGNFQGPFQKHQRRYESSIVESWKNALTEVGNLKGWTLKGDATIKEQSNIVELVVERALRELGGTPLDERKHLVGIDFHVDRLLHLLHIGSNDVQFVGICGMGGLGKTTMAEVVYNRIFRRFNGSSFLTDVREEASQGNKGLVSLQKRLLQDILKREYDISIVSRGSKLIAERLHRENILLILDDVDDHKQLDALVGGLNWFGPGSKVIITTRDVHILNVHKEKVLKDIQIYMPEVLTFENSLLLFSLHAFSKNEPPEKFEQLSLEIVRYADGLPLTLEVLGSFLIDKNKDEWEDTLERLENITDDNVFGKSVRDYDDKVFEKLMISYNKLGEHEKTIFLDVACHFSGWYLEKVISIWKACELHPMLAIKELIQKHLLNIVAGGYLRMHDQLRYMGRRIILQDSYGDPNKRSRLWSQDVIRKVLKKGMGTQMVEGILLDQKLEFEGEDGLSCEDFGKMPNLRFVQIYESTLNGEFSHLPSRLRWFQGKDCHLEIIPDNFYHEELAHLDLSGSSIKLDWDDTPQTQNKRFQKLKVLELTSCYQLSLSPVFFSWFPCLQSLNLRACHSLLELPDSICQMASLRSLILVDCRPFKKLPTSIGDLKHLVQLEICSAEIEELPESVGQLEKLETLVISYCHELVRLPTSMWRMRSLHHFDMEGTPIVKLPDDFSNLSTLEVLGLGSSTSELHQTCKGLGYFFMLPSNLIHLSWKCCTSLVRLPDLSSLKNLRELHTGHCKNLEEIYILEGTESLEELTSWFCPKLRVLSDLSKLKRLRVINITECENLEGIHGLEGTESLEELIAPHCHKLRELSDLSKLKRLRILDISHCGNLEGIHGLEGTESLEELTAWRCCKLSELSDLSKLKRLRKLDIIDCGNLVAIHGLEGTESLEELYAQGCHKVTELPDLSKLKRLRILDITDCRNLERIQGLEGTDSLEELIAPACQKLTELLGLSKLKRLSKLDIKGCKKLTELPDLSKLKRLRILDISNCENLEVIQVLEGTESAVVFDACCGKVITDTRRKIHGQGRLLNNVVPCQGSKSIADDEIYHASPILCVVFAFTPRVVKRVQGAARVSITFGIEASICWRLKRTCSYSIRIENIELTPREIIYMHHFDEFSAESKGAIDILSVGRAGLNYPSRFYGVEVKFWKVLFENKESDQKMPNQQSSAMLVADFFRWLDDDDDDDEQRVEEKNCACLDEDVKDKQQMADQPSHVQKEGSSNRTINFFGSSYGGVRESNVPEVKEGEVETTADTHSLCRTLKGVWDLFCNCFTSGSFVMRERTLVACEGAVEDLRIARGTEVTPRISQHTKVRSSYRAGDLFVKTMVRERSRNSSSSSYRLLTMVYMKQFTSRIARCEELRF